MSVLDVGDAEWILHIDAMRLKYIQVLHPSVLLFVDVSWVHDFKDVKFYESMELLLKIFLCVLILLPLFL